MDAPNGMPPPTTNDQPGTIDYLRGRIRELKEQVDQQAAMALAQEDLARARGEQAKIAERDVEVLRVACDDVLQGRTSYVNLSKALAATGIRKHNFGPPLVITAVDEEPAQPSEAAQAAANFHNEQRDAFAAEIDQVKKVQVEAEIAASHLMQHAERELRRAGLFDADSDYNGMIGEQVLDLVKTLALAGHTGYSAKLTMQVFAKVANFKTLTPLTADPDEWTDIAKEAGENGEPLWQSKRQSSCFSTDGGATYYDIDVDRAVIVKAAPVEPVRVEVVNPTPLGDVKVFGHGEPVERWRPKVGDAVRLTSGGPTLSVQKVGVDAEGRDYAQCVWFNDENRLERADFDIRVLDSY